ncbi:MAG TPA: Gfo/Idh/MocA family oxidoreductase [Tepidisphaeraceae bacterium]|jgi:predicted dehydrogenase|nr:Gfo/Idh/MocA family oxidoreductase [Tepidisphaeraceae bacterium]HEV8605549.1 Gfo/Idh/MocA family oxidoreductase [Tepidisphaeraceae bacterium]
MKLPLSRRRFLKASAAALAAAGCSSKNGKTPDDGPTIVPPTAVSGNTNNTPPPSARINMGFIGIGNMGSGHLNSFVNNREVQLLAMCDVREEVRNRTKKQVEDTYANVFDAGSYSGCSTYLDFRELLQREDIDAVLIAVPEHWHAIIAIEAARAGKDIYCEKPLSHTIREARAMVNAVRRYGRVFQTGSQQRSDNNFRYACELVRNERIGRLKSVHVNVGGTSNWAFLPEEPVPPGLDWDRWLGPAPWAPYNSERASGSYSGGWRLIRDYSGGMMTDWGAHHFDIAQWGLGMDESGPVEIHPPDGNEHKVLTYVYGNGVPVYHMFGPNEAQVPLPIKTKVNGVLFVGDKGWVEVNRGYIKTSPESIGKEPLGPNDIHLYNSKNHAGDWLSCVRTRRRPICDVEVGARSITVCHLGNIAYWLNRSIKWDPAKEEIIGDDEANRMLQMPMRPPWHL